MKHILTIGRSFADAVCDGRKRFELRRNDRGFNAGDTLEFRAVEKDTDIKHKINTRKYKIVYCLNGYGLREGFVAFGFEEVGANER